MSQLLIAIGLLCNFQSDDQKAACNSAMIKCMDRWPTEIAFKNVLYCYTKYSEPFPRKK